MNVTADPTTALEALRGFDLASLSPTDAPGIARDIRRVRGWLDRFEADFTNQLTRLYEEGRGAPAADTHTRNSGCSSREARNKERRGKAIDDAPSFGDALSEGTITGEHADALANATAKLDEQTKSDFLDHEALLLDEAKHSSPEQFSRHCRSLLDRIKKEHGIERDRRQRQNTALRRKIGADGMYRLNGEFHPELGQAIWAAIDAEVKARIAAAGDRQLDRQRLAAEALGDLISDGCHERRPTTKEVCVHIDLETLRGGLHEHSLCEDVNGVPVPVSVARKLCCEADIIPIVLGGSGLPLDVGRSQRLANRAQRRALRAMYRSCGFPGCDVPFTNCEVHHLVEWEQGGRTDLQNMLPLCARHHHVVHDGWQLLLASERELTVIRPDGDEHGRSRPDVPPRREHRQDGSPPEHRRRTNDN